MTSALVIERKKC